MASKHSYRAQLQLTTTESLFAIQWKLAVHLASSILRIPFLSSSGNSIYITTLPSLGSHTPQLRPNRLWNIEQPSPRFPLSAYAPLRDRLNRFDRVNRSEFWRTLRSTFCATACSEALFLGTCTPGDGPATQIKLLMLYTRLPMHSHLPARAL